MIYGEVQENIGLPNTPNYCCSFKFNSLVGLNAARQFFETREEAEEFLEYMTSVFSGRKIDAKFLPPSEYLKKKNKQSSSVIG